MNRSPTPGGMFATNFVGVRNVIAIRLQHFGNPLAAVGDRFIAPAYTYSPTKWQTDMCVRWCGNVYLIMWKHVIDNVDMRVRWNGNTYLMTWIHVFGNVRIRARWIGPLRLTECSQPISWVFATLSQTVRSRRGPIYRARIYENTYKMANGYVCAVKWIHIFNNVETRIWWREYTYLIMWKCACNKMNAHI